MGMNLEAFVMRKFPNGADIKGNGLPWSVFNEISLAISNFYKRKGKSVFVVDPHTKEESELANFVGAPGTTYAHKIYNGEDRKAEFHGYANLLFRGMDQGGSVPKAWADADYAVGRFSWRESKFELYFNLMDKDPEVRQKERDEFVEFIKQHYR